MKNIEKLMYSYMHRKAFRLVAENLIPEGAERDLLLDRARFHDCDKMVLYLFMEVQEANKIHTRTNRHHIENSLEKDRIDRLETIIDMECARYTKPDKPLCAFDVIKKKYPEHIQEFLPLLEELGIASSHQDIEKGIMEKLRAEQPTEEYILYDIFDYLTSEKNNSFQQNKRGFPASTGGWMNRQKQA